MFVYFVMLLIFPSLTLITQVRMKIILPMLAFIKWFGDNHQQGLWTEIMSRLFSALNT
jgi:hypothetical protein